MEDCAPQCEAPMPTKDFGSPRRLPTLPLTRRRELIHLAEEAADWIMQKNIKPEELCFFRQAVQMISDPRE